MMRSRLLEAYCVNVSESLGDECFPASICWTAMAGQGSEASSGEICRNRSLTAVTGLSPVGTGSISTTPTFGWTFPANPSSYTYSFCVSSNTC